MKTKHYQSSVNIISFFKEVKIDNNKSEDENREIIKSKLLSLMQHFKKYPLFPLNFSISLVYPNVKDGSGSKAVTIKILYEFKFPSSFDYDTKYEMLHELKNHQTSNSINDYSNCFIIRRVPLEKKHSKFEIDISYDNEFLTAMANNFFGIISQEIQKSNPEELECTNIRYTDKNDGICAEYDLDVKARKKNITSAIETHNEEEH